MSFIFCKFHLTGQEAFQPFQNFQYQPDFSLRAAIASSIALTHPTIKMLHTFNAAYILLFSLFSCKGICWHFLQWILISLEFQQPFYHIASMHEHGRKYSCLKGYSHYCLHWTYHWNISYRFPLQGSLYGKAVRTSTILSEKWSLEMSCEAWCHSLWKNSFHKNQSHFLTVATC